MNSLSSAEPAVRNVYLGVYGVLGLLSATILCLSVLLSTVGGLNASTKLHDTMLAGVLRYSKDTGCFLPWIHSY